jgi:hypothetical protein
MKPRSAHFIVARKYDGTARPRVHVDIAELIVRMANENSRWGYTRIRGALSVLGTHVGRSTIARDLTDAVDGFLRGKCAGFRATLGADVTTIKRPRTARI